jgi:hypothetical protein
MPQKRYRIDSRLAAPFARGADFSFKLGYAAALPGGGRVVRSQKNAPTITIKNAPPQIVGTNNDWAQGCLEHFHAPQNTVRNGLRRQAGPLFIDVTATTTPGDVDVDLDPIFAANEPGS